MATTLNAAATLYEGNGISWIPTIVESSNSVPVNVSMLPGRFLTRELATETAREWLEEAHRKAAAKRERLQKAAPALLEALQHYDQVMCERWPQGPHEEDQGSVAAECWIKARKALAEAV